MKIRCCFFFRTDSYTCIRARYRDRFRNCQFEVNFYKNKYEFFNYYISKIQIAGACRKISRMCKTSNVSDALINLSKKIRVIVELPSWHALRNMNRKLNLSRYSILRYSPLFSHCVRRSVPRRHPLSGIPTPVSDVKARMNI